ncbi:MAG: hypothetical protein DWQ34_23915 [Planctomycetota bacterium]|nr:MAG: hypothetical protein DWQ29_17905 [Planctomycetota bacterium]REJ87699.1 MAG: hypothetical protein DWQ34_23915 [Planctomycetota bacterium]REK28161.1 MAG: hypothetical protein DWQ41_06205 [Planctomycetota bacterium]REK34408.1 MAG: hypothetical protein DWQ45_13220 [Planctomycetota bacterium]
MAEGPQVLRRTEWLDRHLTGRKVLRCQSSRDDIPVESISSQRVERVFCHGKHIFIALDGGQILHNHLLMRGRWRKLSGQQLFLPDGAWLSLYVGPHSVVNLNGQKLKLVQHEIVDEQRALLGPDLMTDPFPEVDVCTAILASHLPISEALLDQSVVAGVGNIAKSETLYRAGLDPHIPASGLSDQQMTRLVDAVQGVLWDSYHAGGRWVCRVYQRRGTRCGQCGGTIQSTSLKPSGQTTYFCPGCQCGPGR